jgi:glycogen debranching enzyme
MEEARKAYLIGTKIPNEEMLFYQSYLQPFHNRWYQRFDAFGNVLAALSGIASDERAERIIQKVFDRRLDQPAPLRVLDPVVMPGDEDWLEMYHDKQPPYVYHNGGIWPLAGGFWVSLLAKRGHRQEAEAALERLAHALRASHDSEAAWGFHEYLHGQSGQPMGRRHQAWSAASYILAYHSVHHDRFGCFQRPDGAE